MMLYVLVNCFAVGSVCFWVEPVPFTRETYWHDCKTVDWDVKHHMQAAYLYVLYYPCPCIYMIVNNHAVPLTCKRHDRVRFSSVLVQLHVLVLSSMQRIFKSVFTPGQVAARSRALPLGLVSDLVEVRLSTTDFLFARNKWLVRSWKVIDKVLALETIWMATWQY